MGSAALEAWRKRQKAAKVADGVTEGQVAQNTSKGTLPAGMRPWQPGQSGNPGGRPALDPEVREILQAATAPAAKRLAELVQHRDARVALQAIDMIHNRIYGRPVQAVDAKVETTNVQQAHLQILLELQAKRADAMKTIEGSVEGEA